MLTSEKDQHVLPASKRNTGLRREECSTPMHRATQSIDTLAAVMFSRTSLLGQSATILRFTFPLTKEQEPTTSLPYLQKAAQARTTKYETPELRQFDKIDSLSISSQLCTRRPLRVPSCIVHHVRFKLLSPIPSFLTLPHSLSFIPCSQCYTVSERT